jgi:GDP-L-fucose synthase
MIEPLLSFYFCLFTFVFCLLSFVLCLSYNSENNFMKKDSKIYIAGHNGMVGSAIHRNLLSKGFNNFVFTPYPQFDLTDQKTVAEFFSKERPEYVILAAAKVGGIIANNTYRAQFIYENLMIQNNIIHYSYVNRVNKLLFLGSSCIYPKNCPQPIKEEYLLTGELEYTNEPYAIAKIAGIKMCEAYNIQYGANFVSVMPTNLFGPNDNYNLETSHVLPALIRKIHLGKCLENNNWEEIRKDLKSFPIEGINDTASESDLLIILSKYGIRYESGSKSETPLPGIPANRTPHAAYPVSITLWGTGTPYREFLYVDDLAEACVFVMNNIDFKDLISSGSAPDSEVRNTHINIGIGKDQTIKELAELIKGIVGFQGQINWDSSKPDGTLRKLLDINKLERLGWKSQIGLGEGLRLIYKGYTSRV